MKILQFIFSLLFSFLIGAISLTAQEAIPATGGNINASGGSVSYSVGQVFYTTIQGDDGFVDQGVQQPFEIFVDTGTLEVIGLQLLRVADPNPTRHNLFLRVEEKDTENLSYQLFDINGNFLENQRLTGNETTILMTNRAQGIYFLKVIDNKKEIKAFKIIKN